MVDARLRELEAGVVTAAEQLTGCASWGDDDSFRVGLAVLLSDIDTMAEPQRRAALDIVTGALATRLSLVADAEREPGILREEIERPLVVIGMPRTGTTLLHELLALDPAARAPLTWECTEPSPPPRAETFLTDPRIARAVERDRASKAANPELAALHPAGPQLPTECHAFTMSHFDSAYFWASLDVPAYAAWYTSERPHTLYATHRRVLQQLQWRGPRGRWTLKSPPHLLSLEALLQAYPDACLVQTHRDPTRVMASLASVITAVRRPLYPDIDRRAVGASVVDVWSKILERGAVSRDSTAVDEHVIDVAYRDLVADPMGTVQHIHEHFDLPFSSEHRARMEEFLAGAGRHEGGHRYQLGDFGLDASELDARSPEYRDRFGHLLSE